MGSPFGDSTPQQLVASIEMDLSLPKQFLWDLTNFDDWSFVVQCHALLETLMTECLSETLDPNLRGSLARLTTRSKLSFLRDLQLISDAGVQFIEVFSRIRNSFVHDVKQITATLQEYINKLNNDEKKKLRRACRRIYEEVAQTDTKDVLDGTFFDDLWSNNPKVLLWSNAISLAHEINVHRAAAKVKRTPRDLVRLRDLLVSLARPNLWSNAAFDISAQVAADQRSKSVPEEPPAEDKNEKG